MLLTIKSEENISRFGLFTHFRSKWWAITCRRQDLLKQNVGYLCNNIRLCGEHFEEGMFMDQTKRQLIRQASPTLFDIANPPPLIGVKRRLLFGEEAPNNGRTIHNILIRNMIYVYQNVPNLP